jgi:site-specific DNA recombinase
MIGRNPDAGGHALHQGEPIAHAGAAPDLVKAAVQGRLPRGIGVTRLRDAPAEWSRQYAMLGLSI